MSTFVGHALAGAAIAAGGRGALPGEARRRVAALAVAAALLPDVDALVLVLAPPGAIAHRGISHSLVFAVASAAVLTGLSRPLVRAPAARVFPVLLVAALSHLLLDFLMGAGPPIRPFAPFDDRGYLAPFRLLPIAYYARAASGWRSPAFWGLNGLAAALELAILAPPLVIARLGTPVRTRALAATLSLVAMTATVILFN